LFRLESPIHGPKISVLGGFNPQNFGAHRSDPTGTSLSGTTHFEPSFI